MRVCKNYATTEFRNHIDQAVRKELMDANIPVLTLPKYIDIEVKTHHIGILNGFIFYRAWRYWICEGDMPLDLAKELYATHKDLMIRVHGHAANPEPTFQTSYNPTHDAMVRSMMDKMQAQGIATKDIIQAVNQLPPDNENPRFVRAYHIDTCDGLEALAEFIRTKNIYACNGMEGSYTKSVYPNREKVTD